MSDESGDRSKAFASLPRINTTIFIGVIVMVIGLYLTTANLYAR